MKKELHIIGLGKMGMNMATRLRERGYRVYGYTQSEEGREAARNEGFEVANSLEELVGMSESPRCIWIMVPNTAVDDVLEEIVPFLSDEDTIIDGANAFFKNSVRRHADLAGHGVAFLDAGVSGGPEGALTGACIMVGGDKEVFDRYAELFSDLAVPQGFRYVGSAGAGHFVKMVHNGIEYGMMQSIAEGFTLLEESEYDLDTTDIADLYNHGSVIESRLMELLARGLKEHSHEMDTISGTVNHSGMGEWTVETARERRVPVPAIESAYTFRVESEERPSFTGKVLSLMRYMFGGHSMKK